MKMNKLALACGVAMLGLSSVAVAEVSMNIGATSNYIFRGVTLSGDSAAISGGVDWSAESGLYAGAWASNLAGAGDYELDLYGGYSGEAAGFGYDVGLIYYTYPSDLDADYAELYGNGSWNFLTFGLAYTVSSDVDDTPAAEAFIDGDLYYYVGASFDLEQDYSIALTLGRQTFEDDGVGGAELDYTHYQIDLTKSAGDFGDVTLSLSDTDLTDTDPNAGGDSDPRFFVSWSKGF
ncbi:MAG: TorF family putative porin [Candidatus Thiodiazotropha sp. (ex Myrtea spinifera)]|nr:TorF family putative porin [Candidatus Thiodiazotropha sp. (ex Myrtea spinifera)]